MANKLSRTKIANYIGSKIQQGEIKQAINELAAYLVESRRTREADLIVRSVFESLESEGHVVTDITTTGELTEGLVTQIKNLLEADSLEIRQHRDPDVLGGVRIATPTRQLDATIARRLTKLRESKVL